MKSFTVLLLAALAHVAAKGSDDVERAVRLKSTNKLKEMLKEIDVSVPNSASKDTVRKLAVEHDVLARHAQLQVSDGTARDGGNRGGNRDGNSNAPAVGGACKSFCKGSCCYFSNPSQDCSGCDRSWTCNPTAECYATGAGNAPGDFGPASERCSALCKASSCKDFSTPEAECIGCDASYACHPRARFYQTGMNVRDEL